MNEEVGSEEEAQKFSASLRAGTLSEVEISAHLKSEYEIIREQVCKTQFLSESHIKYLLENESHPKVLRALINYSDIPPQYLEYFFIEPLLRNYFMELVKDQPYLLQNLLNNSSKTGLINFKIKNPLPNDEIVDFLLNRKKEQLTTNKGFNRNTYPEFVKLLLQTQKISEDYIFKLLKDGNDPLLQSRLRNIIIQTQNLEQSTIRKLYADNNEETLGKLIQFQILPEDIIDELLKTADINYLILLCRYQPIPIKDLHLLLHYNNTLSKKNQNDKLLIKSIRYNEFYFDKDLKFLGLGPHLSKLHEKKERIKNFHTYEWEASEALKPAMLLLARANDLCVHSRIDDMIYVKHARSSSLYFAEYPGWRGDYAEFRFHSLNDRGPYFTTLLEVSFIGINKMRTFFVHQPRSCILKICSPHSRWQKKKLITLPPKFFHKIDHKYKSQIKTLVMSDVFENLNHGKQDFSFLEKFEILANSRTPYLEDLQEYMSIIYPDIKFFASYFFQARTDSLDLSIKNNLLCFPFDFL